MGSLISWISNIFVSRRRRTNAAIFQAVRDSQAARVARSLHSRGEA